MDLRAFFKQSVAYDSGSRFVVEPQVLSTKQTAVYLNRSEDWVRRELHKFVTPIQRGRRAPKFWRRSDLDALIACDDWRQL